MSRGGKVLVVGATGFVGQAIVGALEESGHTVTPLRAPRLPSMDATAADAFIESTELVAHLADEVVRHDAVVNAAGNPDASERDLGALTAANGVLPGVLAAAVARAGGDRRFVHVSSAVVQGRRPVLDASRDTDAFSAYAASKILGEELALRHAPGQCVVYRPPSVHAPDRRVTRMTGRIARSRIASVARPADAPTPQALLPNVASAVAHLATCQADPPEVVIHPWEGLTTAGLMRVLGGRDPKVLPRWLARTVVSAMGALGRAAPRFAADARRVEMLWFGQIQADSWLTSAGWTPPAGLDAWQGLGDRLRGNAPHPHNLGTLK